MSQESKKEKVSCKQQRGDLFGSESDADNNHYLTLLGFPLSL